MSDEWHLDDADLRAYLNERHGLVRAASAESHLMRCSRCRAALAAVTTADQPGALDLAWQRLADDVDRPSRRSLLRRAGLLQLTLATPALVRAALVAAGAVGLVPLLVATTAGRNGLLTLLLLAPLAPMAAVALAFRTPTDPAGEISLAAPLAGLRLVALRSLVVILVALPCAFAALAALAATGASVSTAAALAWLLPGAALAGLTFAAGTTRLDPTLVAAGLGGLWVAVLVTGARASDGPAPDLTGVVDVLAAPTTQLLALAVALAGVATATVRRDAVVRRRAMA